MILKSCRLIANLHDQWSLSSLHLIWGWHNIHTILIIWYWPRDLTSWNRQDNGHGVMAIAHIPSILLLPCYSSKVGILLLYKYIHLNLFFIVEFTRDASEFRFRNRFHNSLLNIYWFEKFWSRNGTKNRFQSRPYPYLHCAMAILPTSADMWVLVCVDVDSPNVDLERASQPAIHSVLLVLFIPFPLFLGGGSATWN